MAEKILVLTENLFLGKGKHKACYIHPEDASKCVKVPFALPDTDVDRELEYRGVLEKKCKHPTMLTQYYGTVKTDKGVGYLYELVQDFDGKTSKALKEIFTNEGLAEKHLGVSELAIMQQFREQWLKECIVTSDTDFVNYFAQRISPNEFVIRIIDNIGTPANIPLAYYFDYFARKRARKYWTRLMQRYINKHCKEEDKAEAYKLLQPERIKHGRRKCFDFSSQ